MVSVLECLSWCGLAAFAGHAVTMLYVTWRELDKNAREQMERDDE